MVMNWWPHSFSSMKGMKMTGMNRTSRILFFTLAVGVILSGCNRQMDTPQTGRSDSTAAPMARAPDYSSSGSSGASSGASGAGDRVMSAMDDSLITTKVKSALLADSAVKATDILVQTDKGEVLLSGLVANRSQADRAMQIARNIEGVKSVNDKLTVKE